MPVPGSREWIKLEPSFPSSLTKALAVDCEMVGVGPKGEESIVARVSLVNQYGKCVYDKYVKPTQPVTDYRTAVSGIRPDDLAQGGSPQHGHAGGGGWSASMSPCGPFCCRHGRSESPAVFLPPGRVGSEAPTAACVGLAACWPPDLKTGTAFLDGERLLWGGEGVGRRDRLEGLPGLREDSEAVGRP